MDSTPADSARVYSAPAKSAPVNSGPVNAGQTDNSNQGLLKAGFVLGLLIVAGLLAWLVATLLINANSRPQSGSPGGAAGSGDSPAIESSAAPPAGALPLPRNSVSPLDFQLGDCFKDFDPEAMDASQVACDTGHSAQLVAVYRYPGSDSYPGSEALRAKALEACQAAKLTAASNQYTLNFQRAYPSTTSWAKGDRRVDCYVIADAGNIIMTTVLP
ncbi:septum formation family protein [Pseudarthrobacter sp. N5]|uniref:septum formation family protein n=1 Tax=Pseudarthrobacter sp. N5 TaxID=3418416 RepID=UPI003CF253E0